MRRWWKGRPVSPFAGGAKSASLRDCEAYHDALDAWRDALPFPVRKAGELARWTRYRVFGKYGFFRDKVNPRLVWRRAGWLLHRAKYGWSAYDTWSADTYIARVVSQMLVHLADHTHSYPGQGEWDTPEKWDAHLRDLAVRIGTWNDDTFCDKDAFETTRSAMEEFGRTFGHYWD